MTTRAQVERWRAMAETTAPCPWRVVENECGFTGWIADGDGCHLVDTLDASVGTLAHIVASRAAVPAMAAMLERAMAEVERLARLVQDLRGSFTVTVPDRRAEALLAEWRGEEVSE